MIFPRPASTLLPDGFAFSAARATQPIISPAPGGPFVVAWHDLVGAFQLAPVWLHAGWIDVVWRFRRTRLGPFWHTLGLAAFILTMGTVWGVILHQQPAEYFRHVTVSLIVWTLIASFVNEGTAVIIAGQPTALSMRFPYVAFAFAHIWRALLMFAHHFVLYVVIMALTFRSPGWAVLLALPGLALIVLNGVWMSLLVGMMCLRRRDLIPAIASAMQILMFVTPVFWSPNLLGPRFAFASNYNPFYHLIQLMRDPLLGSAPPLATWMWGCGTLIVGVSVTAWGYGHYRDRLSYWY